jgi:lactoylglutathione lyase
MRADHFAFEVQDLDESIAFYTKKLGLPLRFKEVDETHGEAFAFLELEGGDIELLQKLEGGQSEPRPVAPPYTPHLALATDDLDSIISRLEAHGVPIVTGPLEIPGKVRWLYFADPDGNVLEFVQWL